MASALQNRQRGANHSSQGDPSRSAENSFPLFGERIAIQKITHQSPTTRAMASNAMMAINQGIVSSQMRIAQAAPLAGGFRARLPQRSAFRAAVCGSDQIVAAMHAESVQQPVYGPVMFYEPRDKEKNGDRQEWNNNEVRDNDRRHGLIVISGDFCPSEPKDAVGPASGSTLHGVLPKSRFAAMG